MGVHRDLVITEGCEQHHAGGLLAYAGQRHKLLAGLGVAGLTNLHSQILDLGIGVEHHVPAVPVRRVRCLR